MYFYDPSPEYQLNIWGRSAWEITSTSAGEMGGKD
jgi:hypothetical protein